jgi:hypothetical protein
MKRNYRKHHFELYLANINGRQTENTFGELYRARASVSKHYLQLNLQKQGLQSKQFTESYDRLQSKIY